LRRKDVLGSLKTRYQLMDTSTAQAGITGRDVRGVEKVLSGLLKLMYPHGEVNDEQLGELLSVAIEGRQRVRNQLHHTRARSSVWRSSATTVGACSTSRCRLPKDRAESSALDRCKR